MVVNSKDTSPSEPPVSGVSPKKGGSAGEENARATIEAELLERCKAGDRKAFQSIVERYQRRVYGIAWGFVRNRDDALDLTQDVFLKVYRNIGSFQGSSSFYTWLYRVATNVCIDHIRKKKRRREDADYDDTRAHDGGAEGDTPLVSASLGISPSKKLGDKELGSRIMGALDNLSDPHREILLLREVEGLSYEELAEVLQVPKGTVMSRLYHARANMQKQLAEYVKE